MALVESLPLLFIFVVLLSFQLGFFGIVHTTIMSSMASRAYAFETFRNRSDVTMFRDYPSSPNDKIETYANAGNRFHTINDENHTDRNDQNIYATSRDLMFGQVSPFDNNNNLANQDDHNKFAAHDTVNFIGGNGARSRTGFNKKASPAWVMVGYGICIDAGCGD